jgi:hypothetical protein
MSLRVELMPLAKIVSELVGRNEGMIISAVLSELLQR